MTFAAKFEGALGYLRKRETNVLRIESDKFKVCEAKVERAQKYLFAEKTYIVHVTKKGKITVVPLE